jgi:hypothetical protein
VVFLARRQDRRALLVDEGELPSWLVYDVTYRGFSPVGYLDTLLKDHPEVLRHPDLGVVDMADLGAPSTALSPAVLAALSMTETGGFVYGKNPETRHNERLVVAELENATFGAYLHSGDRELLETLDAALHRWKLAHTDRWKLYLHRATKELEARRRSSHSSEMTLTEPLPLYIRSEPIPAKSPALDLVASLLNGYLGYLPDAVKAEMMETGCAFVGNMRLLLKQFPQLEHDTNVLKVDFFSTDSGRRFRSRSARRLLGLEPYAGWVLIRDVRRQIEFNLSETLKRRFEAHIASRFDRAPTTVEKVLLSTLLNEHGIGCTFDKSTRKSRRSGWTTVFAGVERRVLGSAALDALEAKRDQDEAPSD